MTGPKKDVPTVTRLVSVLLIVGGLGGVAIVLWMEAQAYSAKDLIFIAVAFILFGCSVWAGIDLWQGKPRGYKCAQVLFLLQIPNVSFHGFAYRFFLGLFLGLSFSQGSASKLNGDFELASQLTFQISPEIGNLVLGVNLFAIAILIYLRKKSAAKAPPVKSMLAS